MAGETDYQQRVLPVMILAPELVLWHGVAQCLVDVKASFWLARVSLYRGVSSYRVDT